MIEIVANPPTWLCIEIAYTSRRLMNLYNLLLLKIRELCVF